MECRVKDMDVHYQSLGEGRPVVLLHSWFLDHRQMVSRLEPVFRQRHGWKRI
jgi:pimeloyl-ACP methyl ester carboxylesterase